MHYSFIHNYYSLWNKTFVSIFRSFDKPLNAEYFSTLKCRLHTLYVTERLVCHWKLCWYRCILPLIYSKTNHPYCLVIIRRIWLLIRNPSHRVPLYEILRTQLCSNLDILANLQNVIVRDTNGWIVLVVWVWSLARVDLAFCFWARHCLSTHRSMNGNQWIT